MPLTANQLKALNWYKDENNLKVQLSSPPNMYFKNDKNKVVSVQIGTIMSLYNAWNEEDKKARARERALERRK